LHCVEQCCPKRSFLKLVKADRVGRSKLAAAVVDEFQSILGLADVAAEEVEVNPIHLVVEEEVDRSHQVVAVAVDRLVLVVLDLLAALLVVDFLALVFAMAEAVEVPIGLAVVVVAAAIR
jgi:hypothetical protein